MLQRMAPEFLKGRVRRGLVVGAVLACGVSAPAGATASFANRELGIGVAGFTIMPSAAEDVKWGLPITLEGGYYIDSGFMAYLRVPLMILQNDDG